MFPQEYESLLGSFHNVRGVERSCHIFYIVDFQELVAFHTFHLISMQVEERVCGLEFTLISLFLVAWRYRFVSEHDCTRFYIPCPRPGVICEPDSYVWCEVVCIQGKEQRTVDSPVFRMSV